MVVQRPFVDLARLVADSNCFTSKNIDFSMLEREQRDKDPSNLSEQKHGQERSRKRLLDREKWQCTPLQLLFARDL